MPKPSYTPPPIRSRALAARPEAGSRAPAKAISRMDPSVVAPLAADPAALVDLDSGQRLCLGGLAKRIGVTLTSDWTPIHFATGFIVLAAHPSGVERSPMALKLDKRSRLRLTTGVAHRLAVAPGSQVLVTADPDGSEIRLMNLGTLADAFTAPAEGP